MPGLDGWPVTNAPLRAVRPRVNYAGVVALRLRRNERPEVSILSVCRVNGRSARPVQSCFPVSVCPIRRFPRAHL